MKNDKKVAKHDVVPDEELQKLHGMTIEQLAKKIERPDCDCDAIGHLMVTGKNAAIVELVVDNMLLKLTGHERGFILIVCDPEKDVQHRGYTISNCSPDLAKDYLCEALCVMGARVLEREAEEQRNQATLAERLGGTTGGKLH